jgi:hypothetical protein
MLLVTTVHLAPDGSRAGVSFGTVEHGDVAPAALVSLLDNFRHIDGIQNHEAEPHVSIVVRSGRYLVRTGQKNLFLYDARDSLAPYTQLTAAEIVAHLQRAPATTAPFGEPGEAPAIPTPRAKHRGVAATILTLGLALNGYTVYSALYTESVHRLPAITLLTDPAELAMRQHDVVGTFATGTQPGDRILTISPGAIQFSQVGAPAGMGDGVDSYRLGRHDNRLCLLTAGSGVVDFVNIETMRYYGDTYRRTK